MNNDDSGYDGNWKVYRKKAKYLKTQERRNNTMTSQRVKEQSNFFRLGVAMNEYQFPFTAQIIPSLEFADFQTNEQHKVTFLSEHCQQKLKLILKDGEETSMDMTDNEVFYLSIDNDVNYHCVGDVIKEKRRENFKWLIVMNECYHKNHHFQLGQILEIETESKFQSLTRKNKRVLKVKVYPNRTQLSLPADFNLQLRKCSDYNNKIKCRISELAFEGNLPRLIFFPNEFKSKTTDGTSLAGEQLLLKEQYTCRILLGCKMNRNNEMEVHSFPSTLHLDIEVLYGEMPVATFTDNEIRALKYHLIEKNQSKAEQSHQKRFARDIDWKCFEYEDSSDDDEDAYMNTDLVHDNQAILPQKVSTRDENNKITDQVPINHYEIEPINEDNNNLDDHSYIDMHKGTIKSILTSKLKELPSYIKENSGKLEANFQFTTETPLAKAEPSLEKLSLAEPSLANLSLAEPGRCHENTTSVGNLYKTVYTRLEDGYEPPEYIELSEKTTVENIDHSYSYIQLLYETTEYELKKQSPNEELPSEQPPNNIKTTELKTSEEKVYTKLQKTYDSTDYYQLNTNTETAAEDDEYEEMILLPPPLPIKKKSERPVPAKRKDLQKARSKQSFQQLLPEDGIDEFGTEIFYES